MASSSPSPLARLSLERRPKLLKEFLLQDDPYSSNDFGSYPNKYIHGSTIIRSNKGSSHQLLRSRSSRAATATISAINKVISIVKFLPFTSVKSPSIFPLDSSYSPYRYGTITAMTTTTITTGKRTSWCDSDSTAEDLPSWWGENGELLGRKNSVGGYCMETTKSIINKEELCFDENEQHSPVSILESPFQEDDDEGSMAFSFQKRKSMLLHRIQQFESLAEENINSKVEEELKEDEEIEEKAKQLLINCEVNYMDDDQLLFDFFWNELITSGKKHQNNVSNVDEKLLREAKSWINDDYNEEFEWEIEDKREAYIKDMEKVANWNKFEEEKQEFILDLEFEVFNDLVNEVLVDVFSHN